MKKFLMIFFSLVFMTSCTTTQMYYWGSTFNGVSKYEHLAYKNYDRQTPESICELVVLYEELTSSPGGTRGTIPPGICAEYGYILLQEHTLESFEKYATKKQRSVFATNDLSTLFHEKGIEMLQKEIELYPESEKFITPLLNKAKTN